MDTELWPQIPAARTLADQVFHVVRKRILERKLNPGEFVRVEDISRGLGVSRTPVREALSRLASEGFLEHIPHRGFRVPQESLTDLLELYPIVSALELLAGRLALPNLTSEDILRLKELNVRLRDARDRNDVTAAIEINNEFHHTICARSRNRRLTEILGDLRSQVNRLEIWYYSSREHTEISIREHDEIIRLVEHGKFDEALAIFERNMLWTYTMLLEDTESLDAVRSNGAHLAAGRPLSPSSNLDPPR